jgi:glyoxylase-like metal-dependent hydrolase (beta-lactamase superfamily II)
MLRNSTMLTGGAFLAQVFPASLLRAGQQAPADDRLAAMRAQMGAVPISTLKLTDNLTLLSGPGGNVAVLNGPDGKIIVDTFLAPAWSNLKEALTNMGTQPLKTVINTHWQFAPPDNNAPLHAAGATVLAHENTKKRMSEPHHLPVFNFDFPASPAEALPQRTFSTTQKLQANGETLALQHFAPAHTDTDIYVHFQHANVIHVGDTFFNSIYPFIDPSTGGKLSGMIAANEKILALVNSETKIIPGHGPLGTKADLTKTRDMLVTVQERIQKLKSAGKSIEEAVAAKPLANLDATWGKGLLNSDTFVQVAYLSL